MRAFATFKDRLVNFLAWPAVWSSKQVNLNYFLEVKTFQYFIDTL